MLVISDGIHKALVKIANREDLGLLCLSMPFWQLTVQNFRSFTIYSLSKHLSLFMRFWDFLHRHAAKAEMRLCIRGV